jgi:hypothetical protein
MTKTKTPDTQEEITPEDETVTQAAPVAPAPVPGIDLQDIANALNWVNVGIKRGAYERSELRNVLDVSDKFENFLNYQSQAQAALAAQKGEQ